MSLEPKPEKSPVGKVYAKGFYDGLRAAGVQDTAGYDLGGNKPMNEAKLESMLANATAISKKVYDSVPIEKPWSKTDIHNDMVRRNVGGGGLRMTEGCLNTLKDQGFISEPEKGFFVRKPVKLKVKKVNKLKSVKASNVDPSPQSESTKVAPIDLLSDLSEKAVKIGLQLKELSEAIDNAALIIDEHVNAKDQEHSKLVQLKELLKDLG